MLRRSGNGQTRLVQVAVGVDVIGKHSDAASALCEGSVVIHCSDWKIPLGIAGSRWSYRGGGGGNCGGKGSRRFRI
jgi:hypothetical protein